MVFQQYALWPNMTVFQNIAFGLRLRRLGKYATQKKVTDVLALVDLHGHDRKFPGQLSGGQQQRVALARALVLEPKVLLLDEPLSNLDAQLRVKVREEIRDIQRRAGITTVFVTHDQDEALSVSDRVAVLNNGQIEQFDRPEVLYSRPRTEFVARFVGSINFIAGIPGAQEIVTLKGARVPCANVSAVRQSLVNIAVRPEDVRLTDGSGVPARVVRRITRGHYVELTLESAVGQLRAFAPSHQALAGDLRFVFDRALVFEGGRLVADDSGVAAAVRSAAAN